MICGNLKDYLLSLYTADKSFIDYCAVMYKMYEEFLKNREKYESFEECLKEHLAAYGNSFPDEPVLLINFYDKCSIKEYRFNDLRYSIIGGDDAGNKVGIASDGKVYYLVTGSNLNNVIYMAPDGKTLVSELELYRDYSEKCGLPENPSDEELKRYAGDFAGRLKKLDMEALKDENTFWSLIVEQMENEQL